MAQTLSSLEVTQVKAWEQYSWLLHGFSTRSGGISSAYGGSSLNLGWTKEDNPANVLANRGRFLQAVYASRPGSASFVLVGLRQIHSAVIHEVRKADDAFEGKLTAPDAKPVLEGDGLITDLPGVMLAVGIADCVPVLVADVGKRVVAAFHAGWRGTASRIVESGVAKMQQHYGSRVEDLVAAIGPSIGPCCYAVGEEVQDEFASKFDYAGRLFKRQASSSSRVHLDLWEANQRQLIEAGVLEERISTLAECTACSRDERGQLRYFSHRGEGGITGRMLAAAGIAPDANPSDSI